jgi:hypothetical protein
MTTRFIGDFEVGACPFPFCTVWRDAASSGTKVGEQMREFVSQCAIDLCFTKLGEPAV